MLVAEVTLGRTADIPVAEIRDMILIRTKWPRQTRTAYNLERLYRRHLADATAMTDFLSNAVLVED